MLMFSGLRKSFQHPGIIAVVDTANWRKFVTRVDGYEAIYWRIASASA